MKVNKLHATVIKCTPEIVEVIVSCTKQYKRLVKTSPFYILVLRQNKLMLDYQRFDI